MDRAQLIAEIRAETDAQRARNLLDLLAALDASDQARRRFWSNPLLLAISGGLLSVMTGVILGFVEHRSNVALERERLAHLMVRDAIGPDPTQAADNIQFLFEAGLLGTVGADIARAAELHQPVRRPPRPSGIAGEAGAVPPPEAIVLQRPDIRPPGDDAAAPTPPSVPPSRRAPPPSPTDRVLQISSHTTEAEAQGYVADILGSPNGIWIMQRGAYWAAVLPLGPSTRAADVIDTLPAHARRNEPFIRRLGEACTGLAPAESSGEVPVRECFVDP